MRLSPRISTDTCCGFHGVLLVSWRDNTRLRREFILSWEHLRAGGCRLYLFTFDSYNLSPLQNIRNKQKEHDHECNKRP